MSKRRAASVFLITAMLVSILPAGVYGASYTEATYNRAVQNYNNANAAYNGAVANLNNANSALNSARQVESEKLSAYNRAKNARSSMDNELSTSAELMAAKNLVEDKQTAAATAQKNAETARNYPSKYSAKALAEAQVRAENAASDLKIAKDQKQAASEALTSAKADAKEKKAAYEAAQAAHNANIENDPAYIQAKMAVADAEKAVAAAKKTAAEKQAAVDSLGKDFLESTAKLYTFDSLKEDCRNTASLAEYVETEEFEQYVSNCLKPENLQRSIDLIKECNEIREGQDPALAPLEVSSDYMIASIFGNAFALYGIDEYGNGHIFVTECPSVSLGENVAFGCYDDTDPFNGLYYREKVISLARQQGASDVQSILPILTTIEEESVSNGHSFHTSYSNKEGYIRDNILGPANTTDHNYVGHYENIVNTSYKATGFSYNDESGNAEQSFGNNFKYIKVEPYLDENGIMQTRKRINLSTASVEDFEQQFSDFKNEKTDALSEANENLNDANETLASAQSTLKNIENSFETDADTLAEAKAAYENAEAAASSAQLDLDAATTVLNSASSEKDAADAALKEQTDNAHYWQAAEEANSALEKANNELAAAVTARNDVERRIKAKYPEAANMDAAKGAYDAAVSARASAERTVNNATTAYKSAASTKRSAESALRVQQKNASRWRVNIKVTVYNSKTARTAISARWKKAPASVQRKINGYQVQIATNSSFRGARTYKAKRNASSLTFQRLKRRTYYYTRVRVYSGKKIGPWSAVKKVRTR